MFYFVHSISFQGFLIKGCLRLFVLSNDVGVSGLNQRPHAVHFNFSPEATIKFGISEFVSMCYGLATYLQALVFW